ncbi:ketoacyl-ACP synthase III family protein [Streptomyces sp. NPDC059897]|uniref:ketoacyl-ACP synthase III family protein n=1 Tax=Streptomyces sp. NPDC059897 TaxID=3346994 RepID=UPI0036653A20
MRFDDLFISGLATHLPERFPVERAVELGLYDAADAAQGNWVSVAVAGDTPAPDLAVAAGRLALERSGLGAADIDLLVHTATHHQGPDAWSPQHYVLRHTLGTDVPALELRQGCNGMLAAIEAAANHLHADPRRAAALLTSGDNFGTALMDRWRSMTNIVLGDGGTALVVARRPGFAQVVSLANASVPSLELLHRGDEPLFPPGPSVGRAVDLKARAAQYATSEAAAGLADHELIGSATGRAVKEALADAEVEIGDIARVTHMNWAHERFLRRTLAPLGLDTWRGTLEFSRRVGHLGAGDQIAGLDHLLESGALAPGDHVLMIGVGVGISISCAIVRVLERPAWVA